MPHNAGNGLSVPDPARKVVSPIAPTTLPVMQTVDAAVADYEVHADVLALVEAAQEQHARLPWSSLVAAALAATDAALTGLAGLQGRRVPPSLLDAVTDLLDLGLLETSPQGLLITQRGKHRLRDWNGTFTPRLEAARVLLQDAHLAER